MIRSKAIPKEVRDLAQLSLYVEDSLAKRIAVAAKAHNCSASKYVAAIVSDHMAQEEEDDKRKSNVLHELRGSLGRKGFTDPQEMSWEKEIRRRYKLV